MGGLAGCVSQLDGADSTSTTTRRSTTATPAPTDEATTTGEATATEDSAKETPGYKEYHWHGRLFFEIDGTLVDFDQPKYYLENIEQERPETVYFHFHKSAHGPNEWSNEKKVVTFARALDLLPGISYSQTGSGNHVVTYEGTTYSESDSGVEIDVSRGTESIDPKQHEVQHDDNYWVRITTDRRTTADDGPRTGKLIFDVNNRRLNFEASTYERAGTDRFQFRDDGEPYTWYNEGDPITLATALDTLPPIAYSRSDGNHVIEYDAGGAFGGTYSSGAKGTEIIVRQRTTDVNPAQYQLRNGDVIWVYVHTDQAKDNEH